MGGPGEKYHILSRDGVDRGGVTGHLPAAAPPHWLPYVAVDDVDALIARARKLGARVRWAPKTYRASVASVCWKTRPARRSPS
jgi:predicted enzyme related to lactoylglutathione lyase